MTSSSQTTDGAVSSPERPSPAYWIQRWYILVALARSDLRIRYGRGAWQLVNWFLTPFALVVAHELVTHHEADARALGLDGLHVQPEHAVEGNALGEDLLGQGVDSRSIPGHTSRGRAGCLLRHRRSAS